MVSVLVKLFSLLISLFIPRGQDAEADHCPPVWPPGPGLRQLKVQEAHPHPASASVLSPRGRDVRGRDWR